MGGQAKYKNKGYASLVAILVILNVVAFSSVVRVLKTNQSAQNVLMMDETGIPLSVIRQVTEATETAASGSASDVSQSAVSYTHLDVYKRQVRYCCEFPSLGFAAVPSAPVPFPVRRWASK